jgi:hypothetical protein
VRLRRSAGVVVVVFVVVFVFDPRSPRASHPSQPPPGTEAGGGPVASGACDSPGSRPRQSPPHDQEGANSLALCARSNNAPSLAASRGWTARSSATVASTYRRRRVPRPPRGGMADDVRPAEPLLPNRSGELPPLLFSAR